jgi:hypothetical protein
MESTPALTASDRGRAPSRLSTARTPSRATLRVARAIAEAVFARDGHAPPQERLSWLDGELEDFLARAGTRSRVMLTFSFWLVAVAAPLSFGRWARLEALQLAERIRALAALERALPEPLLAVKALLCLIYYEHPDAAREVGVVAPHLIAIELRAPARLPGADERSRP